MTLIISSPKGVPIETSVGTLYARFLTSDSLSSLEKIQEMDRVGLLAIQLATSKNSDGEFESLPEDVLNRLSDQDYLVLATEIAKQSGIRWSPDRPILVSFGMGVKQLLAFHAEERKRLHDSISDSYRFLEQPVLDRLQQQLGSLGRLTASAESLRDHYSHLFQPSSAKQVYDEAQRIQALQPRLAESIIETRPPRIYEPPKFEETPLGKATLEGVRSTREVSQKMDALVEVVGGLNQTLITEVLPGWIKQVEQDQAAANKNIQHAAKGLTWTKWAVIVSVVVSILVTWWQIWVAREIDVGNSEQARKIEQLTAELLAAQKRMIELQESGLKLQESSLKHQVTQVPSTQRH